MDTLATALYAAAGDMLKEHPGLAPWRPPAGIAPRLSDAELVTLATMQAVLRLHLRRRWPIVGGGAHPRDAPGVQAGITARMTAAGQGRLLPVCCQAGYCRPDGTRGKSEQAQARITKHTRHSNTTFTRYESVAGQRLGVTDELTAGIRVVLHLGAAAGSLGRGIYALPVSALWNHRSLMSY